MGSLARRRAARHHAPDPPPLGHGRGRLYPGRRPIPGKCRCAGRAVATRRLMESLSQEVPNGCVVVLIRCSDARNVVAPSLFDDGSLRPFVMEGERIMRLPVAIVVSILALSFA